MSKKQKHRQASPVHSFIGPRNVGPYSMDAAECANYGDLARAGIVLTPSRVREMTNMHNALVADAREIAAAGMDSLTPLITTASINTPVQFLQSWLPGFVYTQTYARKIDDIVGIMIAGAWHDEEVVQGVMDLTGTAVPYGDTTNMPRSSWNVNWEVRDVVRFEEGLNVGRLEEARSSQMMVDSASAKREAAAVALDIQRNAIGFHGYNDGLGRTYGFLNDPALPNYVTVAATGTDDSTLWANKTFLEICADLRTAFVALRTGSGDLIDPEKTPITLAIATSCVDYLSVTSDFGISVFAWLKQSYPLTRIVSAPELNNANGGQNVFYAFAETVPDNSTDGGRTFVQIVQTKFMVVGVAQAIKGYDEDFSNATAGIMCKRPWAVKRFTGI